MLYDPKWEMSPATVDTVQNLIAWLETKDPKGWYNFTNPTNCLLCQYYRENGVDIKSCNAETMRIVGEIERIPLPLHFNYVACGNSETDTFGDALKRARKILAR